LTLEMVLYGKASNALFSDTPDARFACSYASAIATNIGIIAKEIVAEWLDALRPFG
jgi:predicted lipoprotein